MSVEQNKAIIRRVWDEMTNQRKLDLVDELFADDYVVHVNVPGMEVIRGRDAFKQALPALYTAFPDLHETIEDMVAEGDKVVVRTSWTGTHQGEWMGVAPTGKKVAVTAIAINLFVNGKMVEGWREDNLLGLMIQLGVIPTTG